MSGGSYNYLYSKVSNIDDLEPMADRLDELGYPSLANRTRDLMDVDSPLLKAWKAVEWLDSFDWDEQYARKLIEEAIADLSH